MNLLKAIVIFPMALSIEAVIEAYMHFQFSHLYTVMFTCNYSYLGKDQLPDRPTVNSKATHHKDSQPGSARRGPHQQPNKAQQRNSEQKQAKQAKHFQSKPEHGAKQPHRVSHKSESDCHSKVPDNQGPLSLPSSSGTRADSHRKPVPAEKT